MTNARIELLEKRKHEIQAQLAAERAKGQRRAEREAAKAATIIGRAVLDIAAQDPNGFGLMLKQVLSSAPLEERSRAFLSREGLL
jgi:hypothetical protein